MSYPFRELLAQRDRIIIFDGAMGTYLYVKGINIHVNYDELNITAPDLIKSIHEEYIKAGAEVISTNTFGANRYKLINAGIGDKLENIIRSAVKLAKSAAKQTNTLIEGEIGPIGKLIEPFGPITEQDAKNIFSEQISILLDEGVDLIGLETFSDLRELELAVGCIKAISDIPIVAQLTLTAENKTIMGATPDQLADMGRRNNVDVIGFNCSVGPHHLLNAVEKLKKYPNLIVAVQPNSGNPKIIDGRSMYLCTPEYFASYARRYMLNNVRIIGGCCGIHPEHIRLLKDAVKSVALGFIHDEDSSKNKPNIEIIDYESPQEGLEAVPIANRSHLAKRLCEGAFVSSIEITPPSGSDATKIIDKAQFLKENGVDAINIPDGPRASARMCPQMLAVILEISIQMETIIHYCCRDRNVIGMQADLLGASAAGINNILAITGDPPKLGHYPYATAVFDVDSIGLTDLINRLNHGLDLAGNETKNTTSYFTGVGVNPVAPNYDLELKRFYKKIEAGAEFAITQPVFDPKQMLKFLDDVKDVDIPILAGIWPLASYRNAEFLNSEIPEVSIPDYIMDRMRKVTDKDKANWEGVAIARETIAIMGDRIRGVQVSAPFGRVDLALKVLDGFISPDPEYQKVNRILY